MAIASQIEAMGKLPRRDDTWEVGFLRAPVSIDGAPALLPVCASESGVSLGQPISLRVVLADAAAVDERLLGVIAALALGPAEPKALGYLPQVIKMSPGKEDDNRLEKTIGQLGMQLEPTEETPRLDAIGTAIMEGMEEDGLLDDDDDDEPLNIPSLKQVKGLESARLRAFAEAARDFWQARPWDLDLDGETMWFLDPKPPAMSMPMCTAMGGLEQTRGLGFYFTPDEMYKLAEAEERGRPGKLPRTLWSVWFEPQYRLPALDLKLWDSAMLPVASPEAYPVPIGISPRRKPLRPTPVILTEMELVLRAMAAITAADLERGEFEGEFDVFGGRRPLRLRLLDQEEGQPPPLRLAR